jgi:beta-mannosidase
MAETVIMASGKPATATGIQFAPWSCCAAQPGAITHPDQLPDAGPAWLAATMPGTVAGALLANCQGDMSPSRDLDAEDWWFRTTFDGPDLDGDLSCHLCLDGLATLAEVWLNGHRILITDNMFRAYRVDLVSHVRASNELVIGFRSLKEELKKKRPRPRWKTSLVNHQQLRWVRSSLLGRIPGWSPPLPVIGPWRNVHIDTRPFAFSELSLTSSMDGTDGVVTLRARVLSSAVIQKVVLRVGGYAAAVRIEADGADWLLHAELHLDNPPLWWPHTHGGQPLFPCFLHLHFGQEAYVVPYGKLGFRQLHVSQDGGFAMRVNGVPVYCRGVCWTVSDILTPEGNGNAVERDLRLAKVAGVNMIRLGGTMVYESDHFYNLCDELGILVWQDFMFANMDYPVEDRDFATNIEAEATYQISRLAPHPCIAVWCGNSEVEQQAAMRGVPSEFWRNGWFATRLPALCAQYSPEVPYVPSTPSGGALPFHVGYGVAHYYGVGAYQRSHREVRSANVNFAAECLAFANIPGPDALSAIMRGGPPVFHHPLWKQRVPRDTGAGWDFEDVRDFYLRHFFAVDPVKLRSFDPARYLQLSRIVSGEMMGQVFAEWRSGRSSNRGGLVWFFKDLWPAAGWGIVDSLGLPKAAYYFLRRSWLTRQITVTDEGLDGLGLHVTNESDKPLNGTVRLLLLKDEHVVVVNREVPFHLAPRSSRSFDSDAILDGFYDVTYSYRFGPQQHDIAIASLLDDQQQILSEAFYFVTPREPGFLAGIQLDAEATQTGEGHFEVALRSDHFLQSVSLVAQGFLPDDNYFHLPPARPKIVRFAALEGRDARFRATLEALNLKNPVAIRLKDVPRSGHVDAK